MRTTTTPRSGILPLLARPFLAVLLVLGLGGAVAVVVPAVVPSAAPAIVQTVAGVEEAGASASGTNYYCFHSPTGKYRIYSGENNNFYALGKVYATDGSLMWTHQPNDPSYIGGKRVFYTSAAKVPGTYYSFLRAYQPNGPWVFNSIGGNYQNYGLCA